MKYETFKRLPGFADLVKETWQQFRSNPWSLIITFILPPLVILVLVGLIISIASPFVQNIDFKQANNAALPPYAFILFALFYIFAIFLQTWGYISFLNVVVNEKNKINTVEAYKIGLKQFWPYVWLSILFTVVLYGGMILLIIPGFIVAVYILFSLLLLPKNNVRGFKAILNSHALTTNYWWAVLGRLVLFFLCIMAIVFVIGIFFGILAAILPKIAVAVIGLLALLAALLLVNPLLFVYLHCIMRHLQIIKKGQKLTVSRRAEIIYKILGVIGAIVFLIYIIGTIVAIIKDLM